MDIGDPKTMQYSQLQLFNFQKYFQHKGGHYIDIDTQRLTKLAHFDWDSNWCHVNPDPNRRNCGRWRMLFQAKQFIPQFCLSCWKVVITPRTLRELYDLRDLMLSMSRENPFCYCKCGIETRDWTPGKVYGGYFYTDSFEDGMKRWREARNLVSEHISSGVDVVLKRYCTEFEVVLGDSINYERPINADPLEAFYDSIMDMKHGKLMQPEWVLLTVWQRWMEHGWRWGTPKDRKQIEEDHNGGKPLYRLPRTYHPKGGKNDRR